MADRKLCVFICYAKDDLEIVHGLYTDLNAESWLDVWLDKIKLLPGLNWEMEIEKAVEQADIVLVCLSQRAVKKEGYIQKELRTILKNAEKKPEGTIFIVPLRLDDCEPPRSLLEWQYEDYFPIGRQFVVYRKLLKSFEIRAEKLGISPPYPNKKKTRVESEEHIGEEAAEKKKLEHKNHNKEAEEKAAREKVEQDRIAKEQRIRREAGEKAQNVAEREKQALQHYLDEVRQKEQNQPEPEIRVENKIPPVVTAPVIHGSAPPKKVKPIFGWKNPFRNTSTPRLVFLGISVIFLMILLMYVYSQPSPSSAPTQTPSIPKISTAGLIGFMFSTSTSQPTSTAYNALESMLETRFVFATLKPDNNLGWVMARKTPDSENKAGEFLVYDYNGKIIISGKYTKETTLKGPWFLFTDIDQCGWLHGTLVEVKSEDLNRIPEVEPDYCLKPVATSTP